MKRLPQDVVDARNQRLKRASDISLKKEYLPKQLQAVQTPYASYIQVCGTMCGTCHVAADHC